MTVGAITMRSEDSSQIDRNIVPPSAGGEAYDLHIEHLLEREASPLEVVPATVYVAQEDVAKAYREWYKEQVAKDKRDELGRFLFGVSSASIGLLLSLEHLAAPRIWPWLVVSGTLFLVSAVVALYLAVPKNKKIHFEELELVALQRANANEITICAASWLTLWIIAILLAAVSVIR